jgi:type III secretion protein J
MRLTGSIRTWVCLVALAGVVVGCDDAVEVVRVPTEREANEIMVALDKEKVTGLAKEPVTEQRKTAWSIRVPQQSVQKAREVLVARELPRTAVGGFDQMLSNTGLIPTATDERARLMHAMAGELEKTFETYARVTRARVHVVIPEGGGLLDRNKGGTSPSAMVTLKYITSIQPEDQLPARPTTNPAAVAEEPKDAPLSAEQVRKMVASSVAGLEPARVTVAFTPAPKVEPLTTQPTGADRDGIMLMLLGAVGVMSVIVIVLLVMLARARQRARVARRGAAVGSLSMGVNA